MWVWAAAVCASALAGCAQAEESHAETIPPAVLESDDEPDATGALFRNCRAVQRDDDTSDIHCGAYDLEVTNRTETSFEPILDEYIESRVYDRTSGSDEYDTQVSTYQLHVRKDQWPGRSYRLQPKLTGGSAERGFIVVGEGVSGGTISVSCAGKEIANRDANLESDCKSAMIYVLSFGIPRQLFEAQK